MNRLSLQIPNSSDSLENKLGLLSKVLFTKNNFGNMIYILKNNFPPIAKLGSIGGSYEFIDAVKRSIDIPIGYLEIQITDSPVLRKVYSEDRSIYFSLLPDIVANIIPQIKVKQRVTKALNGIKDIACIPIHENDEIIALVVIFSSLTDMQKKIVKDIVNDFENKLLSPKEEIIE